MGNGPPTAQLPPEWEDVLPNITRGDVIRSRRRKCRIGEDGSVWLDDDVFDLDEHLPMALAILRSHPHLNDIRFNLVPGRMGEEQWWAALFGILHHGGIDVEDVAGRIDDDYEPGDEVDDTIELGGEDASIWKCFENPTEKTLYTENGKLGCTPVANRERVFADEKSAPESDADAENACYLREIQAQQAHVARLQKSLREANHKIRKLAMELHEKRRERQEEGACKGGDGGKACSSSASSSQGDRLLLTPRRAHSGTWEMHPDCKDFIELDDHLKENLRKEKEKRMNEVLLQMKFILDTDDIKDSYGKWSCCGADKYDAKCTV